MRPTTRRTVLAQALGLAPAGLLLAACQYQPRPAAISFDGPTPLPPVSNPSLNGVTISPGADIASGVAAAPDLSMLAAALHEAGLAGRLRGIGWYTLFAPSNEAFARLPAAELAALRQQPGAMRRLLRYHLAWGRLTATALLQQASTFGGTAPLPTLAGRDLAVSAHDQGLVLIGAGGTRATLTVPDIYQSNGVINVIDNVLLPGTA